MYHITQAGNRTRHTESRTLCFQSARVGPGLPTAYAGKIFLTLLFFFVSPILSLNSSTIRYNLTL